MGVVRRIPRQKPMFALLKAHPLLMQDMLHWSDEGPQHLRRWSAYIWNRRFLPLHALFGHLWQDPESDVCKAFEPVGDVCQQILEILTRAPEPAELTEIKTDPEPPVVESAPEPEAPLGEWDFVVNRGWNNPQGMPPMPRTYIIRYFEHRLETELLAAPESTRLQTLEADRLASAKTRSDDMAKALQGTLPPPVALFKTPAKPQPNNIAIGQRIVNGLISENPFYHGPPPDR